MLDIERIVSRREKSSLTGLNEEQPRWPGKLTQSFSRGGKVTFYYRTQIITKEQKETWFYSLFATWHNSYCFIFPAALVPATTLRPTVSICRHYSGITQRLLSCHVTTLVTLQSHSFSLPSLLPKLNETNDSPGFCYTLDFDCFENNENERK